ncbi:MAG: hypothetical protein M3Z54_14455, partial [Gemmatimonadota bacterium]|nr:hypothetical protein [Gemmatimonadota bacterium]
SVFSEGLLYTLVASLLFIIVAKIFDPHRASQPRLPAGTSSQISSICFYLGICGLCIDVGLNLTFGMTPVNLTSQRPYYAVLLGYVSAVWTIAGTGFFYQEIRDNAFSRRAVIYLFLMTVSLGTAWSRSAVVSLALMVCLAFAYSPAGAEFRLPRLKTLFAGLLLLIVATASVVTGQVLRGGDVAPDILLFAGLQRIFANNVSLFLAIDRYDDVHRILMEGQPWVVFDQMFSFIHQRTHYPSSLRFVELNGVVAEDERGHVSGYAFGWLGLTYGMAGFFGGLLIMVGMLSFLFWGLRFCYNRGQSLVALLFFAVFANAFLEFPGNLGLDSYVEKLFKYSLYAILAYCFVASLSIIGKDHRRRQPRAAS